MLDKDGVVANLAEDQGDRDAMAALLTAPLVARARRLCAAALNAPEACMLQERRRDGLIKSSCYRRSRESKFAVAVGCRYVLPVRPVAMLVATDGDAVRSQGSRDG